MFNKKQQILQKCLCCFLRYAKLKKKTFKEILNLFFSLFTAHPRHYPTVGEEERYQPLPSRDRLKKTNYFSSSIYANDSMFNMPNTHIYVNMMDYVDSDCCSNDYVDIDEHLESWEQRFRSVYCELTVIFGKSSMPSTNWYTRWKNPRILSNEQWNQLWELLINCYKQPKSTDSEYILNGKLSWL